MTIYSLSRDMIKVASRVHRLSFSSSTANVLLKDSRWYSPNLLQWYNFVPPSDGGPFRLQTGLTSHAIDDIGDITHISSAFQSNDKNVVVAGQDVGQLHWEGFRRTDSDELYHASWENVSGSTSLISPVNGVVEFVFDRANEEDVDEETVLLEIVPTGDESDLARIAHETLLNGLTFQKLIQEQIPGRFTD